MINQSPGGNTQAVPGTTVTIVVAKAATTARSRASRARAPRRRSPRSRAPGFKVAQQSKTVIHSYRNGIVLSQSPGGGATAKKGSTVTITVGKYTAPGPTGPDGARHDSTRRTTPTRASRVAVLGGGRSSEHEVSQASAASVVDGLRKAGHEAILIEVGKDGVWRREGRECALVPGRGARGRRCRLPRPAWALRRGRDGSGVARDASTSPTWAPGCSPRRCAWTRSASRSDGSGRDPAGRLPRLPGRRVAGQDASVTAEVSRLGWPVFVKPARLGSSVGHLTRGQRGGADARARGGVRP